MNEAYDTVRELITWAREDGVEDKGFCAAMERRLDEMERRDEPCPNYSDLRLLVEGSVSVERFTPEPQWEAEQPQRCSVCGDVWDGRELAYMPNFCDQERCPGSVDRVYLPVVPASRVTELEAERDRLKKALDKLAASATLAVQHGLEFPGAQRMLGQDIAVAREALAGQEKS